MNLDWTRLVRGAALLAWAGFFDWLWLSGRAGDYVGPKTAWVVPFGGIVLTITALLYARGIRAPDSARGPSARELVGLLALLAPLLLVAAAPSSSLGALAVERKRSTGDQRAAVSRLDRTGDLTLYDIAVANASADYATERQISDGVKVTIDGLVSKASDGETFEFSRFLASCCAADAMPYSIRVQPTGEAPPLELSQWLEVTGTVRSTEAGFIVAAEEIRPIDRPANPYGV
jgi:uncharacterized repeat protein (TIGR03943 family)